MHRRGFEVAAAAAASSLLLAVLFLSSPLASRLCRLMAIVAARGVAPWMPWSRRVMVEALLLAVIYRGLAPTGIVAAAFLARPWPRTMKALAALWATRLLEVAAFAAAASLAPWLLARHYPALVALLHGAVEIGGTLYAYHVAYLADCYGPARGVALALAASAAAALAMLAVSAAPSTPLRGLGGCLAVTPSSLAGGAVFAAAAAWLLYALCRP